MHNFYRFSITAMEPAVHIFNKPADEAAYLQWNRDHPWGYTAKAEKSGKTKAYVYHYGSCSHMISKVNGLLYTNGREKICSLTLDGLKDTLEKQIGQLDAPFRLCFSCQRRKEKNSL